MDETKNPLPVGVDGISSEINPFTEGLFIVSLAKDQVDSFGSFINSLYQKVRDHHSRQITRNGLTMLRGAIFAIGTRKLSNPEWKEHCASSLREVFHEWNEGQLESDFVIFYKNKGNKLTPEESENFREFRLHYQYFSGIDHHNASTILSSLTSILKNNTLKLEDCYKDEVFIERIKDFFQRLSRIIEFSNNSTK